MNTTFDRYLLTRYLHVFVILFISVFGLFIVIDGFSNVDEFQEGSKSPLEVLVRMASWYSYQSTTFLDLIGPILTVIDGMIVFALLQRNSELHPVLAAGVPTWRLLYPVITGTVLVNGVMAVNQELIIPRIANVLQADRGAVEKGRLRPEALTDHSTGIFIDAEQLSLKNQRLIKAMFVLRPKIASKIITVQADEAVYYPKQQDVPAGWRLKNPRMPYSEIPLTEEGRAWVRSIKDSKDIFVVSEVSFDQLYNRMQSFKFLSTAELVRRQRSPIYGESGLPGLGLHLHSRLVRPLANVIVVLVAVPLILRKESYGLVTNMAICTAVLAGLLAFSETVAYFGRVGSLTPQMAAWLPILGSGPLAAWLWGWVQT